MVLARWAGGSVLRYIRDVPLANLADEVRALEDRHRSARILRDLQRLAVQLEARSTEQSEVMSQVLTQLAQVKAQAVVGPFIFKVSQRTSKLHAVARASCSIPPSEWTTKCGRHVGTWAFTSHALASEVPDDSKCRVCFQSTAASKRAASASKSSESSGTSDGSEE